MVRSVSRGCAMVVALLVVGALTACGVDQGEVVGPETAGEARPAAVATALDDTTLDGPGLALIASRSLDTCAISDGGLHAPDFPQAYSCGAGRVAVYAVDAATPIDAASLVDDAMTARGCTSDEPLAASPAVGDIELAGDGARAITTFYACGDGGAKASFGSPIDAGLGIDLPYLPFTPGLPAAGSDPSIDADVLAAAAADGVRFVLVLNVSIEYLSTSVCNGLHRCD